MIDLEINTIGAIRLFIGIAVLLVASIQDIKKKEASDWNWILMGAAGIVLCFFEFNWLQTLISVLISTGFAFAMFYLKKCGGADSKEIMALSLLVPYNFIILGFIPIPFATLAFVLASLPAFPAAYYYRKRSRPDMPYMPFLLCGFILANLIRWFLITI